MVRTLRITGVQATTGRVPPRYVQDSDRDREFGERDGRWRRWWFGVGDGHRRFRRGRGQVGVGGVGGRPLTTGRVQWSQRVVQRRAFEQQPGHDGHDAVTASSATVAAAAAPAAVRCVNAVADGRTTAPGQLRRPVRGHGGHPA